MYETVIWATDGSDRADAALQEALRLARLSEGRVVGVHCDQRLSGRAAVYSALADEEDRRIKLRRQIDELRQTASPSSSSSAAATGMQRMSSRRSQPSSTAT